MLVKLISEQLIVLETAQNEELSPDTALELIKNLQQNAGLEQWPSAEIESFRAPKGTLIMIKPIRVYIPQFFERLLS